LHDGLLRGGEAEVLSDGPKDADAAVADGDDGRPARFECHGDLDGAAARMVDCVVHHLAYCVLQGLFLERGQRSNAAEIGKDPPPDPILFQTGESEPMPDVTEPVASRRTVSAPLQDPGEDERAQQAVAGRRRHAQGRRHVAVGDLTETLDECPDLSGRIVREVILIKSPHHVEVI